MMETTYSHAQFNLAEFCDNVVEDRDVVIIHRQGGADVALIAADELSSLMETAHLLRSPANAERLLAAMKRANAGEGEPMTVDELRRETELG